MLAGEEKRGRVKKEAMEVFVCPCCCMEFSLIGDLKKHQHREHPDALIDDCNFNICVCQKIFNNDSQFLQHLRDSPDDDHRSKYNEMVCKMRHFNNGTKRKSEEDEAEEDEEMKKIPKFEERNED